MNNYLDTNTVSKQEQKKKRLLIAGAIITAFFAFGVIGGITGYSEDLKDGITIYAVFMIPGLILLYSGYKTGRMNDLARRYETIFSGDRDGFVHIEELTRQTGKDSGKVFSELDSLFGKGYFHDCTLQRGGQAGVILTGRSDGEGIDFTVVKCESCGGTNRIRKGTAGVCEYCGSDIRA